MGDKRYAMPKRHKIETVLIEFNIGLDTLVNFLQKRGRPVEANPNAYINWYSYALLKKEFYSQNQTKQRLLYQPKTVFKQSLKPNKNNNNQPNLTLLTFAQKAIQEGGFLYYLTEGGVRMYKRFEDNNLDSVLKKEMLKGCFDREPLPLALYGGRTQFLIWNKRIEKLMVLSKEEIDKREAEEIQKAARKKKIKNARRLRKSKSWRLNSPSSNFDMISSSSGSGAWLVYHHNGPKR